MMMYTICKHYMLFQLQTVAVGRGGTKRDAIHDVSTLATIMSETNRPELIPVLSFSIRAPPK
jgi:hypothetical protein